MDPPTSDIADVLYAKLDPVARRALDNREWYLRTLELLGEFGATATWSSDSDWKGIYETFLIGIHERDSYDTDTDTDPLWQWDWLLYTREAIAQVEVVQIIVEQLLSYGIDPEEFIGACIEYAGVRSLLYCLSLPESNKVRQDKWNEFLLRSVVYGDASIVEALLRDGRADPLAHAEEMFDHAVTNENGPVVWALLQDGRLSHLENRDSVLQWAIEDGYTNLVRFLQSKPR